MLFEQLFSFIIVIKDQTFLKIYVSNDGDYEKYLCGDAGEDPSHTSSNKITANYILLK